RERVAVQVGRHITRHTGVGVLPPRATEALGLLVHGDVGEAGLGQLHGAENAGHAGTDDDESGACHRVFSFRGRSPSSERVTTQSATTEAGTPSSVESRRRASWLMMAAIEKATMRAGASTMRPAFCAVAIVCSMSPMNPS